VPEGVVDLLEPVQVQEQQADRRAPLREGEVQPLEQPCPVGQAREGVLEGLLSELLLVARTLGDVG